MFIGGSASDYCVSQFFHVFVINFFQLSAIKTDGIAKIHIIFELAKITFPRRYKSKNYDKRIYQRQRL